VTRRARIALYGSTALLIVAGAVCATAFTGETVQVVGFLLIGAGLIIAMGLVFLEVGLSEDRERAREREATLGDRPAKSRRVKVPRAERSRGHRRRLR
jgi:hypothetical protein